MWLLDHTCATPAENLALDEVLLDEAEAGRLDEVLRFWESPTYFAVLGLSQAVDTHVYRETCDRDGVPILRRCSAGGCVLQGPGCLNFSLILRLDRPGCGSITASYRTILGSIATALIPTVTLTGISDLAIDGRKVSGNAQRRRGKFFLHHGTLLLNFDISKCSTYLREPDDRPEYRAARSHGAFIRNLNLTQDATKISVSRLFQASQLLSFSSDLAGKMTSLAGLKYNNSAWIFRK